MVDVLVGSLGCSVGTACVAVTTTGGVVVVGIGVDVSVGCTVFVLDGMNGDVLVTVGLGGTAVLVGVAVAVFGRVGTAEPVATGVAIMVGVGVVDTNVVVGVLLGVGVLVGADVFVGIDDGVGVIVSGMSGPAGLKLNVSLTAPLPPGPAVTLPTPAPWRYPRTRSYQRCQAAKSHLCWC